MSSHALSAAVFLSLAGAGLAIHLASMAAVLARGWGLAAHVPGLQKFAGQGISLVRPVSQVDPFLRETLASSFGLDWPAVDIIFCAARETDPAVATVRELLARHPDDAARLLVGDTRISPNPKLNNCVKGWEAARHDLVAIIDSNVLLPRDYVQQMLARWDDRCGLVTSPPAGSAPDGFWAEVECAFLNSHQARWQLLADGLGMGFAQGKNLLFRKSLLEPLGGIARLAGQAAEDAAATKVVREAGYRVRLSRLPFPQPLGQRSLSQIWARQLRWARLRRVTFPLTYAPEAVAGSALPIAFAATGLWLAGANPAMPLLGFAALWFGSELAFARAMGWPARAATVPAMILRDAALPLIWLAGFAGSEFVWQGHSMSAEADDSDNSGGNGYRPLSRK